MRFSPCGIQTVLARFLSGNSDSERTIVETTTALIDVAPLTAEGVLSRVGLEYKLVPRSQEPFAFRYLGLVR